MSRGKYSVRAYKDWGEGYEYNYNSLKQLPPNFNPETDEYDPEIHFADYDEEGYDPYGYSSYDTDGKFIGNGAGIDRAGYTEMDYLTNADGGDDW